MSQITKRALVQSLKNLLLEKPLSKITVTDITEDCGISRMTFYYHFKDIYDLVEWACMEDAAKALANKKTYDTWQQGFIQIFHAVRENKVFVMNVYRCVSREQVEKYLVPLTDQLIMGVIAERSAGMTVREEDKQFIAQVHSYSFVGLMLDWIKDDMRAEPELLVNKLALVIQGSISAALERFRTRQIEEIRMHIRQDFFDDLLSGKLHSAEEVGSIAGMHNMDAEGTYLCMVTKLDSAARGTENYVEMQDAFLRIKDRMIAQIGELSREEGRSCISIHRGSLIITFLRIVHTEPDQRISEENRRFIQRLYHRLHAITQQYVLNIGVGEPTARLINVRRSFTQAKEAIRVSGNLRSVAGVHFYEDLIIYQLLSSGVENEKSAELYTLSIRSLVEYDKQNATNMVETLDCYFACNCNVSETAKALFIHRNTLIYRIDKIKSILGRDLKDSEERLLLQLGLRQIREAAANS